MTRSKRAWAAGLIALIAGCSLTGAAPASGQNGKSTTLLLLVHDAAGVPAGVLEQAKEQTRRVFQDIDVETLWLEHGDARLEDASILKSLVVVNLLALHAADRTTMPGSVCGLASPGTHLVTVFYNRIESLSPRHNPRDTARILGHVVAHEIGHLLLPPNAHSLKGIMRASMDTRLAAGGSLFFTPSQGQRIRTKLAASLPIITLRSSPGE
jgi:hypothetical protein